jgi:tetratricopeptide (TPR) repeat protein
MRRLPLVWLLACAISALGQSSSSPSDAPPANSPAPDPAPSQASQPAPRKPSLAPPRSDRINADDLGDAPGESSSKDTQIDLSPPENDGRAHPRSSDALTNAEAGSGAGDVAEFHPWDPHKAAKDVEVGDFYFKRKNYRAAEDRYREALLYKENDAIATFRLSVCLDKMDRPGEARQGYESYLKILPHGPEAEQARKALERLRERAADAKPAK